MRWTGVEWLLVLLICSIDIIFNNRKRVNNLKIMNIIVIFLVLTVILNVFAGCSTLNTGEKSIETQVDDTGNLPTNNTADNIITEMKPTANVPDRDFDGGEFRISAVEPGSNLYWTQLEIDTDKMNGEIINDSIYTRNFNIEERFNTKIIGAYSKDPTGITKNSIMAGEDYYHVLCNGSNGMSPMALTNMLYDLHNIPFLDFDMPWWDSNSVKAYSVMGKLFFATSDLTYRDKEATWAYLFNKDLINDYNLNDPYELVRNMKWTFEDMYNMTKKVTTDLDGDSDYDQFDRFGLLSQYHDAPYMMMASGGVTIASTDTEGIPYLSFMSDNTYMIAEKVLTLLEDKRNTFLAHYYKGSDDIWNEQLLMFANGQGLFKYTLLDRVLRLRSFDFNFGILPTPLMYESQLQYLSPVDSNCQSAIAIPATVVDSEFVGIILEALTAESRETLIPAYYDTAIKGKALRDEESIEMLDIIFENRIYDLGVTFNIGSIYSMLNTLVFDGNINIASYYKKIEKKTQKSLDDFIEKLQLIG